MSTIPNRFRTALVTGGSGGLGRAIAVSLASSGVTRLVVHYHGDAEGAARTCEAVQQAGGIASMVRGDLGSDSDIIEVARSARTSAGAIDILVNNAGTSRRIPLQDLDAVSAEVWQQIMQVNLYAPFALTKALAPSLRAQRGTVINIASDSAFFVNGSSIPYCVSKAGLVHLTKLLAAALAPDVSVNSIAPSFVNTPWLARVFGDEYESLRDDIVAQSHGSMLESEEIAQGVLAMIAAGPAVTGQTLMIDRGASLVRDLA